MHVSCAHDVLASKKGIGHKRERSACMLDHDIGSEAVFLLFREGMLDRAWYLGETHAGHAMRAARYACCGTRKVSAKRQPNARSNKRDIQFEALFSWLHLGNGCGLFTIMAATSS